jgi:para-nitrobenzyl esterase
MFYIHGGGLNEGNGEMDGVPFVRESFVDDNRPIVLVTINYRLNGFGFLALSSLSWNDNRKLGVSGNYGFLDQILALTWVNQNIAKFGGDPNRITIFGQSSGGTSVLALLVR